MQDEDIETICLMRFGNRSDLNMLASEMFLDLHGEMIWYQAGLMASGIVRSFK